MKKTCQKHCFSTLNHNLAHCYNDARVIKWMWEKVKRGFLITAVQAEKPDKPKTVEF